MIEFVTLFLALTVGRQPVELMAAPMVAAVELRLDGDPLARLDSPPWRVEVDFGDELLPHELLAVAFDESGNKLGEARQWLNYGRALVEARWALDPAEGWPPKRARLVWTSFDGESPEEVAVRFDGRPMDLPKDLGAEVVFDLGDSDADSLHSLEAELRFRDGLKAQTALTFGGAYSEDVSSSLTALALRLPDGAEVPAAEVAASWLRHEQGRSLEVHSVKREQNLVLIVRDRYLPLPLPVLARDQMRELPKEVRRQRRQSDLFFLESTPRRITVNGLETSLFKPYELGPPFRQRGVFYVARRLGPESLKKSTRPECCQKIYDAVAVAGKLAGQSGRRRAVLLLRKPGAEDLSDLSPRQAEDFLEAMRVPYFQWRWEDETSLVEVAAELDRSLERQIVVWLEGSYLPQEVVLTDLAPPGTSFAGGPEVQP